MNINLNGFFTDKGSVSVKVRNNAKLDMIPLVKKALDGEFDSVMIGTDGAYYISLGEVNGKSIYARLELTISVKTPE
jgi:hypothetical protein